jgi:hypothetical protein
MVRELLFLSNFLILRRSRGKKFPFVRIAHDFSLTVKGE